MISIILISLAFCGCGFCVGFYLSTLLLKHPPSPKVWDSAGLCLRWSWVALIAGVLLFWMGL